MSAVEEVKKLPSSAMPHVPLEILEQIAENISDLPTARAMSLSCKVLRDCGEAANWSELDLTSGYDRELSSLTGLVSL